jgi:hypothetical protein
MSSDVLEHLKKAFSSRTHKSHKRATEFAKMLHHLCDTYNLDVMALVKTFDVFSQSHTAKEHTQAFNDLEKALNHVIAERNKPQKKLHTRTFGLATEE